jgi:predicted phage tail protein
VSTTAIGGDTESVKLSASGLPTGVSATFGQASVTPGGSSSLTLSTSSTTPAGTYPITITGAGTSNTHTTTYTLTVTTSGGPSVPPTPTGLTASANQKKVWVMLNWSESQSGVKFNLYRNTSATMPSSPTYTGISTKSFTDKSVTAGSTYYYWVTAVNSAGQSPPNGPVTVKV